MIARWDSGAPVKRHTVQASGLVLAAFVAGVFVGMFL